MDDNTSLREKFRSKMSVLQEALDNSPYAEKKGICIPIDDVLTAILAIYYYLNRDEVEQTPNPEKKDEVDVKPEQTPNPDTGSDDGGSGTGEVDDSASSDITPYLPIDTDWSKVDWKKRVLDRSKNNSKGKKGCDPSNSLFWVPESSENDPYGFWGFCKEDKNFIQIVQKAAATLNGSGGSYKQFNAIHFYNTDPDLTIGFQHLAVGNEQKLIEKHILKNPRIYEEMCRYFVYRLMDKADTSAQYYREQVLKDEIIADHLGNNIKSANEMEYDDWLNAIKFFFSKSGVLKDGDYKPFFSKQDKISCLDSWAEENMKKYRDEKYLVPGIKLEKFQMDYNRELKKGEENSKKAKTNKTFNWKYIREEEDKYQAAGLFQNSSSPDSYHSGFWFYEIFKDVLLLKSIAAEQIKYWWKNFYIKEQSEDHEKYPGVKDRIIKYLDFKDENFEKNIEEDSIYSSAVCIFSALGNNAFPANRASKMNEETQYVKYVKKEEDKKTKKVVEKEIVHIELTKDQYTTKPGRELEDRQEAMIFLLGMIYIRRNHGRHKVDYLLNNYWKNMWFINGELITKIPKNVDECKLVCRSKEKSKEIYEKERSRKNEETPK
jgi:hypothetical protein